MKKIALLLVMAVLVMACKSSSGSMTAKPKETNIANKAIKGGHCNPSHIVKKVNMKLPC